MINIKKYQMTRLVRLFLVLILFAGCSKQIGPNPRLEEDETFKAPQGNIVNAPLDFSFLVQNPINQPPGLVLKNKTIEARVLKDIEDMRAKFESYTNPVNLPPYPALLEVDMSKLKLVDHYYHASSTFAFNFNNIYSLYFWGKYTFDNNGKIETVYIADALNFDLTTGNQLTVSDLLVNGADVQKTFNDLLVGQLNIKDAAQNFWPFESEEWSEEEPFTFQMTDAFSGIKGNQLFYIGLDGINFIFDDRHPDFKTGNNPLVFHVPFYKISEELAISERFKTETSLYEQPVWDGRLLILNNYFESSELTETILQNYKDVDIFLVTESFKIPDSYKEVLPETTDDELLMMIEKVKTMIDSYTGSAITKATITKSVHAFGNYISVEWGLNLDTLIQDPKLTYDRFYHVYNKQGEPVTLGSLFVEGFPYEKLLIDRMKNFENFEKYSQQELLDSLQFSLSASMMKLHSSLLKSKDVPVSYFTGSWYFYDIGIENLNLYQ